MVGRLLSCWDAFLAGAKLVSGSVTTNFCFATQKIHGKLSHEGSIGRTVYLPTFGCFLLTVNVGKYHMGIIRWSLGNTALIFGKVPWQPLRCRLKQSYCPLIQACGEQCIKSTYLFWVCWVIILYTAQLYGDLNKPLTRIPIKQPGFNGK